MLAFTFDRQSQHISLALFYCSSKVVKTPLCTELTVRAGLKLEAGTTGSVSSGGPGSDLQQVGSVGL